MVYITSYKNGKSLGMVDPIALPTNIPLFRLVH